MTKFEKWYLETAEIIVRDGVNRGDRTGTGSRSVFSVDHTINLLEEPFPILSCREQVVYQSAVEMIGFMNGIINSQWYAERGCPFWNGFGLPEDVTDRKRREDYELAEDYCSEKGKYRAHEPEYRQRYKDLNEKPYQEGIKLITDYGIDLYKTVYIARKGDLGPIYGAMWRNWPNKDGSHFDQLRYAFDQLKNNPDSRRILVNGWNPSFMPDSSIEPHENVPKGNMSLTPCHVMHEYYTSPIPLDERIMIAKKQIGGFDKDYTIEEIYELLDVSNIPKYYLDICWFQRSWDFMLGAPANIMGYTIMLMMMAKLQNMIPRNVSVKAVHVHVYNNHLEGLTEIIRRRDAGLIPECSPSLKISTEGVDFIDQFTREHIELVDYTCLDKVKFPISI